MGHLLGADACKSEHNRGVGGKDQRSGIRSADLSDEKQVSKQQQQILDMPVRIECLVYTDASLDSTTLLVRFVSYFFGLDGPIAHSNVFWHVGRRELPTCFTRNKNVPTGFVSVNERLSALMLNT